MIYSTNRTSALGDIAIDVNESYYGVGYMNFLQESAEDELALFEMAIKSDIDEVLIGESSYELEALNENFIENAVNKIKELVKKFIEWIKGITRSAIAKLSQLLVRDNAQFVKIAEKQILAMKNKKNFKYVGKGFKSNDVLNFEKIKPLTMSIDELEEDYEKVFKTISGEQMDEYSKKITEKLENFDKEQDRYKDGIDDLFKDYTESDNMGIDFVEMHIKFLKTNSRKHLDLLKKQLKNDETKAKNKAKNAEKAANKYNEKDTEESKLEKKRLNLMAEYTSAIFKMTKRTRSNILYALKQEIKVARAVVTKAMGASPKNEGFYTEELLDAMIETANYEYDEALEEMSEPKEHDLEDDIDDEE